MIRRFCAALLIGAVAALAAPSGARAGHTLPRVPVNVTIKGKDHRALRAYFLSQGVAPDDFDDAIDKILLKSLPPAYRTGCREMIEGWGKKAKGTSELVPRGLQYMMTPDSVIHIFAAFTCFSTRSEFGSTYFDERLAVLDIGTQSTRFAAYPLGPRCDTCTGLSTFSVADDSLKIGGSPMISIAVKSSNDNPCCGGRGEPRVDEVSLWYFRIGPQGAAPLGSLLNHRLTTSKGTAGKDSVSEYTSSRTLNRDADGNITQIVDAYILTVNDTPVRQGSVSLIWNRKRQAFDTLRN